MAERILIDALAARHGGAAYAAMNLAQRLAMHDGVAQVCVVTRSDSIVARGLAGAGAVRCTVLPAAGRLELARRVAWEAYGLPALVRKEGSSVVISMSGMLPRAPGARLLCLLLNPVMYEQASPANALRRWAVRRTVHSGVEVAAPSRHMAALVSASTGRECAVVPLGVDHGVFHPDMSPGSATEILCVADFYPHKRHDIVLDAWQRLAEPRPTLRLIGNPGVDPETYARVLARAAKLPGVEIEHGLPLDQLVGAYRRARVFVLPSEQESFCIPVAESMACGVPCVVSDLASLHETGGDGASYVAGDDPQSWATALEHLMRDDGAHERARAAALAWAMRFSWERMATEVLDLI